MQTIINHDCLSVFMSISREQDTKVTEPKEIKISKLYERLDEFEENVRKGKVFSRKDLL